jgi:hypothetical protein
MQYEIIPADELGLVSCRQCQNDLLGPKTHAKLTSGKFKVERGVVVPPPVYMWAGGAPYCYGCSVSDLEGDKMARRVAGRDPKLGGRVIHGDASDFLGD